MKNVVVCEGAADDDDTVTGKILEETVLVTVQQTERATEQDPIKKSKNPPPAPLGKKKKLAGKGSVPPPPPPPGRLNKGRSGPSRCSLVGNQSQQNSSPHVPHCFFYSHLHYGLRVTSSHESECLPAKTTGDNRERSIHCAFEKQG